MSQQTITLSESHQAFVDAHVRAGGVDSASDYIAFLIQVEQLKRRREQVDRLLLEAVNGSPATPMTNENWKEIEHAVFGKPRPKRSPARGTRK